MSVNHCSFPLCHWIPSKNHTMRRPLSYTRLKAKSLVPRTMFLVCILLLPWPLGWRDGTETGSAAHSLNLRICKHAHIPLSSLSLSLCFPARNPLVAAQLSSPIFLILNLITELSVVRTNAVKGCVTALFSRNLWPRLFWRQSRANPPHEPTFYPYTLTPSMISTQESLLGGFYFFLSLSVIKLMLDIRVLILPHNLWLSKYSVSNSYSTLLRKRLGCAI